MPVAENYGMNIDPKIHEYVRSQRIILDKYSVCVPVITK